MNSADENDLRNQALSGAERVSKTLHDYESELPENAEMSEGIALLGRAAEATDQVLRLLSDEAPPPSSSRDGK